LVAGFRLAVKADWKGIPLTLESVPIEQIKMMTKIKMQIVA